MDPNALNNHDQIAELHQKILDFADTKSKEFFAKIRKVSQQWNLFITLGFL